MTLEELEKQVHPDGPALIQGEIILALVETVRGLDEYFANGDVQRVKDARRRLDEVLNESD